MWLRDHLKRGWKGYLAGLVCALVSTPPFYWNIYWYGLTDDGHGIYTAPEDIDPAPVLAEPWPPIDPAAAVPEGMLPRLSAADLPTYFFPPGAEDDENGIAIRRFEPGKIGIYASSKDEPSHASVAARLERLIAPGKIPVLFIGMFADDGSMRVEEGAQEISLYPARKEYKPRYRHSFWEGEGPLGQRMNDLGCVGRPDFFYTDGHERHLLPPEEAFIVRKSFVATWHRLDEPTVDHCLFKALLVALGLHPTEGFFFKEGPVTPDEQARALAALALVYHPAVQPGMTEPEFTAALLENGLIDP